MGKDRPVVGLMHSVVNDGLLINGDLDLSVVGPSIKPHLPAVNGCCLLSMRG